MSRKVGWMVIKERKLHLPGNTTVQERALEENALDVV